MIDPTNGDIKRYHKCNVTVTLKKKGRNRIFKVSEALQLNV